MGDVAATAVMTDLDGTLWDSVQFYARALGTRDQPDLEAARRAVGEGGNIVGVLRSSGITRARFASFAFRESDVLRLYPSVLATLDTLSQKGVPTAVVTNLPEWLSRPMLEATGLSGRFNHCEFVAAKPSPRGLQRALIKLGVGQPEHLKVLYVGDRASDERAAKAAGVRFAWASYGYADERLKVEIELPTFAALLELL